MLKTKVPLRDEFSSSIDHVGEMLGHQGRRHGGREHRRGEPYPSNNNINREGLGSGQGHWHGHRHAHGDAFGPRRGGHWRQHESPKRYQSREHVSLAQSETPVALVAPQMEQPQQKIPGGYDDKDIYDTEVSVANLAEPIVPDNKVEEKDSVGPQHEEKLFLIEPGPAVVQGYEVATALANVTSALSTLAVDRDINGNGESTPKAATPSATPKEPVTPLDIFSWVRHQTIQPGCTLPAGTVFTKTWRSKHFASGSEYDFDILKLVHQSSGILGEGCKSDIEFVKGDIVEDGEVEISITGLKVPDLPGREIVEHWRLVDDKGIQYGQPLRLRYVFPKSSGQNS